MRRTTPIERQKTAVLKAARAAIRLKHTLAADEEIAEKLPELEEAMNLALAEGKPFEIEPGEVYLVER
jgi:hypothetical protein